MFSSTSPALFPGDVFQSCLLHDFHWSLEFLYLRYCKLWHYNNAAAQMGCLVALVCSYWTPQITICFKWPHEVQLLHKVITMSHHAIVVWKNCLLQSGCITLHICFQYGTFNKQQRDKLSPTLRLFHLRFQNYSNKAFVKWRKLSSLLK